MSAIPTRPFGSVGVAMVTPFTSEGEIDVEAAQRLGWTQTRFNRKLDNVCDKLDKAGVRGLHGGPTSQAHSRRANLVDWAVSSRLVTADHLPALDAEAEQNRKIGEQ